MVMTSVGEISHYFTAKKITYIPIQDVDIQVQDVSDKSIGNQELLLCFSPSQCHVLRFMPYILMQPALESVSFPDSLIIA